MLFVEPALQLLVVVGEALHVVVQVRQQSAAWELSVWVEVEAEVVQVLSVQEVEE